MYVCWKCDWVKNGSVRDSCEIFKLVGIMFGVRNLKQVNMVFIINSKNGFKAKSDILKISFRFRFGLKIF